MRRPTLLRIRKGDKLVVLCDRHLTADQYAHIMDQMKEWAGDIPVLILSKGFLLTKVSTKMEKRLSRRLERDKQK